MALLEVTDLSTTFTTDDGPVRRGRPRLVLGRPGKVLGIVGESGCGKSVTNLTLMGLLDREGRKIAETPCSTAATS